MYSLGCIEPRHSADREKHAPADAQCSHEDLQMAKPETEKIECVHCNRCLRSTDHTVVAERKIRGSELYGDDFEISWEDTYTMLECCGCHDVTLRRRSWFSEVDGFNIEFYPPQVSRRMPEWADKIPRNASALLKEIYAALHSNSMRLAVMGARSLVHEREGWGSWWLCSEARSTSEGGIPQPFPEGVPSCSSRYWSRRHSPRVCPKEGYGRANDGRG